MPLNSNLIVTEIQVATFYTASRSIRLAPRTVAVKTICGAEFRFFAAGNSAAFLRAINPQFYCGAPAGKAR